MRILLVEDDVLLGDGIRAGLRQQGFQVDWVRDGDAAQRELRAHVHAATVLDIAAFPSTQPAHRTLPVQPVDR